MTTIKILKKIFESIINILFPQTINVKILENMSIENALETFPESSLHNTNIWALFQYHNPLVKTLVWQLKYKNNKNIARLCGELLYNALIDEFGDAFLCEDFSSPILVPIPITKSRRKERGYNQNELLINAIIKAEIKYNKYPIFETNFEILKKVRDTVPQSSLKNRKERLTNLSGCFCVQNPKIISGRNIILIDDVSTTGTTLKEATGALTRAGAKKVYSLTIAH